MPNEIGNVAGRITALRRTVERQPIIPGLELRRLDNFFFAVRPTEAASGCICDMASGMRRELGLRGRLLDKSCLHVTLHGVGEFEGLHRSKIAQAAVAASSVSMPAFEIGFDRVMSFGSNGQNCPLVLKGGDGHTELRRLHRLLGEAMRRAGLWRTVRSSFTPHVTLLYDSLTIAERPVPTVRWTVREFVLIHSPQGHSRHHHIGRWELE